MKAADWIDRVKASKGLSSDYSAAKQLGVTTSTISWYRRVANKTLDEETAIKVAHALEINPSVILADQSMERARNDEARTAWAEILKQLGGVAAGLFVALNIGFTPSPAQAAQTAEPTGSSSVYYVK